MRILYFYRGLVHSTQHVHIYAMIRAWRSLGHEALECFPLSASADGTSATATRVRRLPPLLRNFAQIYADRPVRKALERACRDFQPDFIYERYALFSKCAGEVARRAGIPLIMEVNSAVAHLEPEHISLLLRPWSRKRELRTLLAAGALFTVSGFQAQRLAALGVPAERIRVTHNAVDPTAFRDLASQREGMRSRLRLGSQCALLLLHPWNHPKASKGILDILRRLSSALGAEADAVVLVSVGGGPLFPDAQEVIGRAFPRAVFAGHVPHEDIYPYLAAADVGLIPWHEAFTSPLKLFEFMAAGLAVLAPNLAGISEVLRSEENGLLFPAGDVQAMAAAIVRLSHDQNLRMRLGHAARRDAFEKHTWENNARQVLAAAMALQQAVRER